MAHYRDILSSVFRRPPPTDDVGADGNRSGDQFVSSHGPSSAGGGGARLFDSHDFGISPFQRPFRLSATGDGDGRQSADQLPSRQQYWQAAANSPAAESIPYRGPTLQHPGIPHRSAPPPWQAEEDAAYRALPSFSTANTTYPASHQQRPADISNEMDGAPPHDMFRDRGGDATFRDRSLQQQRGGFHQPPPGSAISPKASLAVRRVSPVARRATPSPRRRRLQDGQKATSPTDVAATLRQEFTIDSAAQQLQQATPGIPSDPRHHYLLPSGPRDPLLNPHQGAAAASHARVHTERRSPPPPPNNGSSSSTEGHTRTQEPRATATSSLLSAKDATRRRLPTVATREARAQDRPAWRPPIESKYSTGAAGDALLPTAAGEPTTREEDAPSQYVTQQEARTSRRVSSPATSSSSSKLPISVRKSRASNSSPPSVKSVIKGTTYDGTFGTPPPLPPKIDSATFELREKLHGVTQRIQDLNDHLAQLSRVHWELQVESDALRKEIADAVVDRDRVKEQFARLLSDMQESMAELQRASDEKRAMVMAARRENQRLLDAQRLRRIGAFASVGDSVDR